MQEKVSRITSLIEKFLEESISPEEERELNEWLAEAAHNDSFFRQITDKNVLREKLKIYAGTDSEAIWKKTLQKIDEQKSEGAKLVDLYPEKKSFRIPFGKIAAAAVIILLISGGTWYFLDKSTPEQTAKTETKQSDNKSQIMPGGNKAILTLGDGSEIALNNEADGNLADQGHMQLTKTDGRLIYKMKPGSDDLIPKQDLYNTVTTPRGGEYKITLPDGSKVWLNAASSLRFPIAFAGNERIVELTGEAYFEVNPQQQPATSQEKGEQNGKIAKTPFIVKINTPAGNKNEVEVLGTHFNVMAYTDESAIKTTLIEGKVKVTSGNNYKTIRPGEQAKLKEGNISIQKIDAENVVAWTNGFLPVAGPDVAYTMRQIARWYDVTIKYEGGKAPEGSFSGNLPRTANIESVIELLKINNIKARLNEKERTIIVKS
ncbi:FecR domain-containing protein [Longitalea luteola]|uniref:FecR domain-containing protein n=1 Tax=Longitalea luteola TaxID=2812563 RepID=UPI001A95AE4F|nr:FecR domain-containing protein [Longitalea luteola]